MALEVKRIIPRLYISSSRDAENLDVIVDIGVSHVLCVGTGLRPKFPSDELKYLIIPVEDSENGNLLPYFDQCFRFIEEARRDDAGGVLINCVSGTSASGAVCIAYLSRKFKISLKESLELVHAAKKSVRPNPAFVAQLKAYHQTLTTTTPTTDQAAAADGASQAVPAPPTAQAMAPRPPSPSAVAPMPSSAPSAAGLAAGPPPPSAKNEPLATAARGETPTPSAARQHTEPRLAPLVVGQASASSSPGDPSLGDRLAALSVEPPDDRGLDTSQEPAPPADSSAVEEPPAFYACKMCRHRLFGEPDVTPHEPGEGQTAFKWHKRGNNMGEPPACTSLFLDEMDWMGDIAGVEGKLTCPKCQSRVGSYSWAGGQCSCGAWQTPCFQVLRGRVDEKRVR